MKNDYAPLRVTPLRCVAPVLLFLMLAACSHNGSNDRTLTFTGLAGEPDSLNPLVSSSSDLFNLSHAYLSYLLESDNRGRLVPEIAQTVPTVANGGISGDGRTIVYHLRKGVRWQDGPPLTAGDVAFTYRAIMNPANNVLTRVGYAEIERLRVLDSHTISIHLRRPFSPILAYFFGPQGGIGLLPRHLLAGYSNLNRVPYNQHPIGSGPYQVQEWKHGDRIVFRANAYYWRGTPKIKRLVYRIIPDPNTRMEQLQTGEVSAYFDVDPQLLPQVRAIPGVRIHFTPVNDIHILEFNVRDPILQDGRVRRAIAYAVDRKKLIVAATHGAGIPLEGDQPVNGWAYDRDVPTIPYDPVAARGLLDSAGWRSHNGGTRFKNGRPLELSLATAPQGINGSPLVATLVQRYLHDVGISVSVKQYAPGLMWSPQAGGGILASGKYQLAYYAWWTLGPDPDDSWNFACEQIPPAGENYYFWCDAHANAAMHAALTTFDRARRAADYAVVERALVAQIPELTLWQVNMPDAYRGTIVNFAPSPAGSTFWNIWQWQQR